jgi:formylmethanofuran:tetrahydromethanopterin formyltransferase
VVSFQITVLKVLDGHPEGRLTIGDLKRAVAILISSGSNWTDRTKRLAARAPGLDIFSQGFVVRDDVGWQITDAGRAFLAFAETHRSAAVDGEQAREGIAAVKPILASPPIRLVAVNRRRPRRRPDDRVSPSAAVA